MPIMFMTSIVGGSPKKVEIGGVAPTESPAAMVDDAALRLTGARLGRVRVEPRLEERRATDRECGVDARRREGVGGLGQRDQLAVVVADVEDRDLRQVVGALTMS